MALRGARERCSGSTILTRTDLLPVPFLIAGRGGSIVLVRRARCRPALLTLGRAGGRGRASCSLPWTIYASSRGGPLHPGHQGQRGGAVRRHLPARRRHDDGHEEAPRGRAAAPPPRVRRDQDVQDPGRGRAGDLRRASHPDLTRDQALAQGSPEEPDPLLDARSPWRSRRCSGPRPSGCGSSTTAAAACTTSRRRCGSGRSFLVLACGAGPPRRAASAAATRCSARC